MSCRIGHWTRERYLEFASFFCKETHARIDAAQLESEIELRMMQARGPRREHVVHISRAIGIRASKLPHPPFHCREGSLEIGERKGPGVACGWSMQFNLHGLESVLLSENAKDAIVEIEIADEVLVPKRAAYREPKSRVHGSRSPMQFPCPSKRAPPLRPSPK